MGKQKVVVEEWTKDNRFVLDRMLSAEANPIAFHDLMDTSRIGIMGMSIGGALRI